MIEIILSSRIFCENGLYILHKCLTFSQETSVVDRDLRGSQLIAGYGVVKVSVPDPKLMISDPDPQIENQEFGSGSFCN